MKNLPYFYDDKQMDEIQEFITDNFGEGSGYILHEMESEYVHTDVLFTSSNEGNKTFVTFGMGARPMQAPSEKRRCELVLCVTNEMEMMSNEGGLIASELMRISKFPFREDTWFGTGHTIETSKRFKETFGYDCLAFNKTTFSANLSGIDEKIDFLLLTPIYKEERDWCINNNTLAFLSKLNEVHNNDEVYIDLKREILIPEDMQQDEIDEYNLLAYFNMDWETYYKLCEHLNDMSKNGKMPMFSDIEDWVKENRK